MSTAENEPNGAGDATDSIDSTSACESVGGIESAAVGGVTSATVVNLYGPPARTVEEQESQANRYVRDLQREILRQEAASSLRSSFPILMDKRILAVVGALAALLGIGTSRLLFGGTIDPIALLFMGLFGLLVASALLAFNYFERSRRLTRLRQDLGLAIQRRDNIVTFLRGGDAAQPSLQRGYFDRIASLNIDNLTVYLARYYGLVEEHTQKSFALSRQAGALGFLLIVVGLTVSFVNASNPAYGNITFIATASGIVTEFIAGVFFYLYSRTVRQLKEYHDSLIRVQNVFLGLTLVADTIDAKDRATLVGQLLAHLVNSQGVVTAADSKAQAKSQKEGKS